MEFTHKTVLLEELVDSLNLKKGDIAVDCTAGGGGHTKLILKAVGKTGKVIALDRDMVAIRTLEERFQSEVSAEQLIVAQNRFSHLDAILAVHSLKGMVQGIGADLGVSSPQLDEPNRGFSFQYDGPLDMRMDPSQGESAQELLSRISVEDLQKILQDFGEEPKARTISRAIIRARDKAPITSTAKLAELVKAAARYPTKSKTHPATRTFMAIRMAVNGELDELFKLMEKAFDYLRPGGRLAIISFHSLEDRMIKHQFKKWAGQQPEDPLFRDLPIQELERQAAKNIRGKIIKPFPLKPAAEEVRKNARSRSAKLRVIEKLN